MSVMKIVQIQSRAARAISNHDEKWLLIHAMVSGERSSEVQGGMRGSD